MELLSTDKAATSLQVWEGGPTYKANKNGVVNVENSTHAKILRQMGAGTRLYGSARPETVKCACGGQKFPFQRICGDCYRKEEANA